MSLYLPTATGIVPIAGAAPTMSSREIAELVESRHDDVKRSIVRLAERGVITLPPLAGTSFKDAAGKTQRTTEYRLQKRDSYVVVAQLSPEFTARLVDRWQELEAKVAQQAPNFAIPGSFAEALRLAADQAEQIAQQEAAIALMAPKAAFHDTVADAVNTQDMNTVAKKVLGTGRNRLFKRLRREGVLMDNNQPYQRYVDADYFRVIEQVWHDKADQSHTNFKTLVTGKGLIFIKNILDKSEPSSS